MPAPRQLGSQYAEMIRKRERRPTADRGGAHRRMQGCTRRELWPAAAL